MWNLYSQVFFFRHGVSRQEFIDNCGRGGSVREGWLAGSYRFVALKEHNTPTLVSCGEVVAGVIELDRGDNVGCVIGYVISNMAARGMTRTRILRRVRI